jgi:hypothetical protein
MDQRGNWKGTEVIRTSGSTGGARDTPSVACRIEHGLIRATPSLTGVLHMHTAFGTELPTYVGDLIALGLLFGFVWAVGFFCVHVLRGPAK